MGMNSAVGALFGTVGALGALAAPFSAGAQVGMNYATGSASQIVSGTTPSITVSGTTIPCTVSLSIAVAAGITVGAAYPIPPPTVLGDVVGAGFTGGSPFCSLVKEYVGPAPAASVAGNTALSTSSPWPIEFTATNTVTQQSSVIIRDFILYTTAFGYCYGNVTGTYSGNLAATNPNTLAIPSQSLTHANSSGVVSGTCTINSGVLLAVTPGLF